VVICLARGSGDAEPSAEASHSESSAERSPNGTDELREVRAPGSNVILALPAQFEPAPEFGGFKHTTSPSSILVMTFPTPMASEQWRANQWDRLKEAGVSNFEIETIEHGGGEAVWGTGEQTAPDGSQIRKYVLLFGDDTATIMVVGNAARGDESVVRDGIRSARIDPGAAESADEQLSFSVDDVDGLIRRKPVAGSLALTETGPAPRRGVGDAALVLAPSISPAPLNDAMEFARWRLRQVPHFAEAQIVTADWTEVGSHRGVRITARAQEEGVNIAGVLTLIPTGPDSYFMAFGRVDQPRRVEYFRKFDQVLESLRL
jgi:hypothetical protein